MKNTLKLVKFLHGRYIFGRRAHAIAKVISTLIPKGSSVLDIGCGDGTISSLIKDQIPNSSIKGVEVMAREDCKIPCKIFDGKKIPYYDSIFDVAMLVDVFHHTADIDALLKEAIRVSRKFIIIKDHLCQNKLDFNKLKLMDWIGNRPDGVALVYNYKSRKQWKNYFAINKLEAVYWTENLPLYSFPANYLFGKNLHFIASLRK